MAWRGEIWSSGYAFIVLAVARNREQSPADIAESPSRNAHVSVSGQEASITIATLAAEVCG